MSGERAQSAALHGPTRWAALGAMVLGVAAFASGLTGGHAPRSFGALVASWIFFAGATAGAGAFGALFRIVRARWSDRLVVLGRGTAAFAPAAMAILLVLLAGSAFWAKEHTGWLQPPLLVIREIVLNALLFGVAYLRLRGRGASAAPSVAASIAYCLFFAVALSVWAFDFVLGPAPEWASTLIGVYVFVSAFVAGTGVVTLLGIGRRELADHERRDAAAFVLAITIFWGYLFWSQYLTIWYGNIPDEIGFALRRAVHGWGFIVLAVVGLVFAVPFLALLSGPGRRSLRVVRAVLVLQLLGLWLNCHLLIVPSLSPDDSSPLGLRDIAIALGVLGAFVFSNADAFVGSGAARGVSGSSSDAPLAAERD